MMTRFLLFCLACSFSLRADMDLTSRFILRDDPSCSTVANVPLPSVWWSRPYEYLWAAQFAGPRFIVLDAACGISHPFKWHLGATCLTTWACDIDSGIANRTQMLEKSKELGTEGYNVSAQCINGKNNVRFVQASITALPSFLPRFDRIFCISVLEHLPPADRQMALWEFSRTLMTNGLVIITIDYPLCSPEELLKMANNAGLTPAGPVTMGPPPESALFNSAYGLYVYRCVLKRKF
jgi:ubiquinone/menaquinone biosynthesis C-methylase UbiE